MRYAYNIDIQGNNKDIFYAVIDFDRELTLGNFYLNSYADTPPTIQQFMDDLAVTVGVNGDFVRVTGGQVTIRINPFGMAETVKRVVKKVQRRYAPFEGVLRVPLADLRQEAAMLNRADECIAADLFVEAAKLFPNQDPIRLAAGIKDLGLPVTEALIILRKLANDFQGENADMIRLVAGYKIMLAIVRNA